MKRLLVLARISLVLALAVGCTSAAPSPVPTSPGAAPTQAPAAPAQPTAAPKPLEKVTLRFDWLFIGYYAPFFVALDKGWYREAGMDITMGEGKSASSTIQLIGSGADTFGTATGAVLAQTAAQGVPVVMIAAFFQKGAEALLVREDSNIRSLKDMEGKSWGGAPGATAGQLLPALFKANGIDPSKVNIISVDNTVKTQGWLEGKYDAMSTQITDEMVRLQLRGVKYRAFPYADHGVTTIGTGLIVNTKTIQEKPDLVKGFVAASLKGWKYSFEHPEEAARIMMKVVPEAKVEEAVVVGQLKASLTLSSTDNTKGKPFGWMSEKDWQKTVDVLAEYVGLKEKPSLDRLFTNQFIPND